MLETTILKNLQQLPKPLQEDVLHYIESLLEQQAASNLLTKTPINRQQAFGIWQGKVRMADDFDAPLNNLKDYM